ncbi:hypothetical protein Acy02nite_89830 [Actinoplanes cyaneus]|uniref:Uncharacterized protein n=1 Tax=Actinoplanes cyaneus TaxID=52696 RepID=A0A919IV72_9ACTN|nr:hypothetical protein [Actinoplanes cyaneus]MCW2144355.1 hypothetical protein [Actinoplanes cyaneus]GID71102.1 hypothetical protein Acy02nite_89830 [Actinoplanes cyaneus]
MRVPKGLRANIRGKRLDTAVARIIGAVQGIVPAVFPWADKIDVESNWSYVWWEQPETITLPTTDENTVTEPATAAEEAALVDGVDTAS